jgi:energy-coupling factor transporter ATP-binding protein EcfA2
MIRGQIKRFSELKAEREFSRLAVENLSLEYQRGSITELYGPRSSGKTSLVLSLLGELTRQGEVCAVIDVTDNFDPETALLNGVVLENLLWVKCSGEIEKSFMIADYLVQANGFGAIWLNLNFLNREQLRIIPGSFWYRFRAGIRNCPTVFIVTAGESITGSAAGRSYQVRKNETVWNGPGRFKLLKEFITKQLSEKGKFSGFSAVTKIPFVYRDV